MTIICSWCKKVLGEKPPRSDASITHSICAQCQKKLMAGNRPQNKNLSRTHLKKGSPEAKAWGERMRALRGKRTGKNPSASRRWVLWDRHLSKTSYGNFNTKRSALGVLETLEREFPNRYELMTRKAASLREMERAQARKHNPKGDYSGTLKLPTYIDRAVARVLYEGPKGLDWEWGRVMTTENKLHFANYLVNIHHPLAYEAGPPERRYKRFILEYVMPYIEKNPTRNRSRRNPGAAWHAQKRKESHSFDTQMRRGKKPTLAMFYHGKEVAHSESEMKARELGMNQPRHRQRRVSSDTYARNPIAVYTLGNPRRKKKTPPHANGVAGILYHRCLEVRAEKTVGGPGFKPGLYRHPFAQNSGVQILALDNGDLLLHSTRGKRLWGTEQS